MSATWETNPPCCVCDEPEAEPLDRAECEQCEDRPCADMCHGCHRGYGPRYAEVRAAWREHLEAA